MSIVKQIEDVFSRTAHDVVRNTKEVVSDLIEVAKENKAIETVAGKDGETPTWIFLHSGGTSRRLVRRGSSGERDLNQRAPKLCKDRSKQRKIWRDTSEGPSNGNTMRISS